MGTRPQEDVVLGHLLKGLSLSALEASNLFRVYRLAARIHRLKARGHTIVTTMRTDVTGKAYGSYSLVARNRHGVRKAT